MLKAPASMPSVMRKCAGVGREVATVERNRTAMARPASAAICKRRSQA